MNNYLVATIKSWNIENFKKLKQEDYAHQWFLINKKEDLTYEYVKEINPQYIFFPHWSWLIPKEIYENFECIVFHMTDLPYGRGGSPLQNLIVRGQTHTKVSAIRVVHDFDAGDIYMKRDLPLKGKAEDIYRQLSQIVLDMIKEIVRKEPQPVPQSGEIVAFKRRKPEDGNLIALKDLKIIYDYIRMLDAEGYPRAYMEVGGLRLEFENAVFANNKLTAKVNIILKKYE